MKTIEEIRADLKELPHISQMIAAFQKAKRTLDGKETAKDKRLNGCLLRDSLYELLE